MQEIVERKLQESDGEVVGTQERHEKINKHGTSVLAVVDCPEDGAGEHQLQNRDADEDHDARGEEQEECSSAIVCS